MVYVDIVSVRLLLRGTRVILSLVRLVLYSTIRILS